MRKLVPCHSLDNALDVAGVQMDFLAFVFAVFREGVDDEAMQVRVLASVAKAQEFALEGKAVLRKIVGRVFVVGRKIFFASEVHIESHDVAPFIVIVTTGSKAPVGEAVRSPRT